MDDINKDHIDSLSQGLVMCDTQPSNPYDGDCYLDINDGCIYVYDGNQWVITSIGGDESDIIKEKRNKTIDELILESKDDEIERLKKEIERLKNVE